MIGLKRVASCVCECHDGFVVIGGCVCLLGGAFVGSISFAVAVAVASASSGATEVVTFALTLKSSSSTTSLEGSCDVDSKADACSTVSVAVV